jgi:hypothetical protein
MVVIPWKEIPAVPIHRGKFYILISRCGVALSPLGTSATIGHIVPAPDDRRWVWSSRWNENWQRKPKYSEKTRRSAILSTTNPTWHQWDRTRADAVGSLIYYGTTAHRGNLISLATCRSAWRPKFRHRFCPTWCGATGLGSWAVRVYGNVYSRRPRNIWSKKPLLQHDALGESSCETGSEMAVPIHCPRRKLTVGTKRWTASY